MLSHLPCSSQGKYDVPMSFLNRNLLRLNDLIRKFEWDFKCLLKVMVQSPATSSPCLWQSVKERNKLWIVFQSFVINECIT